MTSILTKLNPNEYASYYKTYLEKVEDGDIIQLMINDLEEQLKILVNISEEKYTFRYAEGKWTIGDLITHCSDSESVFSYRALTFSRNDTSKLPGFDQNSWADNTGTESHSKEQIIGYFKTTRNHTIALYKTFNDEQMMRIGNANESSLSVRAIAFIILGHNRHHFSILKNRYLA